MKHLYAIFFFFFLIFAHAQDGNGEKGGIAGFELYPNPTVDGKVYITTQAKAPKKILVFDVLGTQVLQTTLLGEELNVSDLGAGVYLLRVIERDKVATRKLVVK